MDALTSARPPSIRSLPTTAWLQRRSRSRSTRRIQFVNLVNTPRRPTPIERSVRRPGQVRNCPVAPTIGSTPKAWAEGEGTLRRPRPWLPLYQRRRRRRRPDLRRPPKRRSVLRTSPVGCWRARCQDPWGQPPPIFMRPSACRRSAKTFAPTWALHRRAVRRRAGDFAGVTARARLARAYSYECSPYPDRHHTAAWHVHSSPCASSAALVTASGHRETRSVSPFSASRARSS